MAPTTTPVSTPVEKLQRDIRSTARARYTAARRLGYHHRLSTWTTAVASLALLLIPLLQAYGFQSRFSDTQLQVLQVLLAVFLLVYSLLLSSENFAVDSAQMHSCGVELTTLANEIEPLKGQSVEANEFAQLSGRYKEILQKYPSHNLSDFYSSQFQASLKEGGAKFRTLARLLLSAAARNSLGFFHYFILLGFLSFVIWGLFQSSP